MAGEIPDTLPVPRSADLYGWCNWRTWSRSFTVQVGLMPPSRWRGNAAAHSSIQRWSIGDAASELDYHLHENPDRKRAPFAWLTDFVGYLPMPDGGQREALLTADYNAEMVEHVRGVAGQQHASVTVRRGLPSHIREH
jgi:hypothetical protein